MMTELSFLDELIPSSHDFEGRTNYRLMWHCQWRVLQHIKHLSFSLWILWCHEPLQMPEIPTSHSLKTFYSLPEIYICTLSQKNAYFLVNKWTRMVIIINHPHMMIPHPEGKPFGSDLQLERNWKYGKSMRARRHRSGLENRPCEAWLSIL